MRPRRRPSPEVASRRSRAADAGFTLVELVVVVLLIGVLAAIATPVYLRAQGDAADTAARSDLVSARIALQGYTTSRDGAWPVLSAVDGAANAAALRGYGWASSRVLDASAVAGGSPAAYCMKATSGSGAVLYLTESIAPTTAKPASCR